MSKIPAKDMKCLEKISQIIFDKKGFNILTLDVRECSSLTEYFVIAEGNVEKHVQALANHIIDALRECGKKPLHIEGQKEGSWIVLDFSDMIIHLFIPDFREKYALEQLWQKALVVDVPIRLATHA